MLNLLPYLVLAESFLNFCSELLPVLAAVLLPSHLLHLVKLFNGKIRNTQMMFVNILIIEVRPKKSNY